QAAGHASCAGMVADPAARGARHVTCLPRLDACPFDTAHRAVDADLEGHAAHYPRPPAMCARGRGFSLAAHRWDTLAGSPAWRRGGRFALTPFPASVSSRFGGPPVARFAVPGPPLELPASDGTGLVLVSFSARVVADEPLAFTELSLTFENPANRQLEG